jgi:hypothetical protein
MRARRRQKTLVIDPTRMRESPSGGLAASIGHVAIAADDGLSIADHANDDPRCLGLEEDKGPGKIDGFRKELVRGLDLRRS